VSEPGDFAPLVFSTDRTSDSLADYTELAASGEALFRIILDLGEQNSVNRAPRRQAGEFGKRLGAILLR
jgi:hypothetical protein